MPLGGGAGSYARGENPKAPPLQREKAATLEEKRSGDSGSRGESPTLSPTNANQLAKTAS